MYLVKILRSFSIVVSIYHEKRKAPFKNIKIIKSLRCKFKVTRISAKKIDFWVTFVLIVFTKFIFFINIFCVIINVVVITEELLTIFREFSADKFICKILIEVYLDPCV